MTVSDLRQKYASTLEQLLAEAQQNEDAAKAVYEGEKQKRQKARQVLSDVEEVMKNSHRGFWYVARSIIGMIFKKPKTPEQMQQVIAPLAKYQDALTTLPGVQAELESAYKAEANARQRAENNKQARWQIVAFMKELEKLEKRENTF